jgi:phage terminase large subunit
LGDLVFDNWIEIPRESIPSRLQIRCGVDFGYHDALTFTISFLDKQKNELYIVDGLSFTKLNDLKIFADSVKDKLEYWGLSSHQLITGDNSDPRSSDILRGHGLNMNRAIKGSGSKFAGLMFMKSLKIFVNKDFLSFKESMRIYTWKKSKDGISTDDTNHEGSDYIDSVRYALENDMRNNKSEFGRNNSILR